MIYYKIKCKYTVTEETDEAKLMRFWRKADSSYVGGQIFRVIILDRDETTIDAILMFSVSDYSLSSIKKRVISEFDETGETIKSINFSKTPEEIIIKQSSRLVKEYGNTKIDKSIVSLLSADDFDINAAKVYKTEKIAIGF